MGTFFFLSHTLTKIYNKLHGTGVKKLRKLFATVLLLNRFQINPLQVLINEKNSAKTFDM